MGDGSWCGLGCRGRVWWLVGVVRWGRWGRWGVDV